MSRLPRRLAVGLTTTAMVLAILPASAQLPELPGLPEAPAGAVGALLDPLEDLLDDITQPLGDALGDIPLDNAVTLTAEDAVDASIALSRITFETSEIALIGRDDVFADTLSSTASQGITGAPLLLTQTDALDPRIAEELARLGVSRIIILGSDQAISERLAAEFAETYGDDNVSRVGGPSRVETAALLADLVAPDADRAVLLRAYPEEGADQSQAYADALSVGPYASINEFPALLTTSDYLHPAAMAYFESSDVQEVTIVGGEAAVGPEVVDELTAMGITVSRIDGDNRWDTSILLANAMGFADAADTSRLILSEGGAVTEPLWAAGFAAAAQGAIFQAPVILADGALLPPETLAFLGDGLISNALRLSNLPLICNSFVSFLACETAALLLLGALDEVNALTGGVLEDVLGPAFGPLAEALDGAIPGPGEMSPGLVGQVLGLIGLEGDPEEAEGGLCTDGIDNDEDGEIDEADECEDADPEAPFLAAMESQPTEVQAAFQRMAGPDGQRVSPTRQVALIDILGHLNDALPAPVDTTDAAQAEALVTILDAITETLGDRSGNVPLNALDDLLSAVEDLVGELLDTTALSDLVAGLGVDTLPVVEDLVGTVGGLLAGGTGFSSSDSLVDAYGDDAAPLAATIDRVTS